jgi:hypothetical protein
VSFAFPVDLAQPVQVHQLYDETCRSRTRLLAVASVVDPEHNERYQRRIIDSVLITVCNFSAVELLRLLGVVVPQLRANDLFEWFPSAEGVLAGWRAGTIEAALEAADRGLPVVAVLREEGHGHIAVLMPRPLSSPARLLPYVCQAGARNFNYGPIEWGFGSDLSGVRFFIHD